MFNAKLRVMGNAIGIYVPKEFANVFVVGEVVEVTLKSLSANPAEDLTSKKLEEYEPVITKGTELHKIEPSKEQVVEDLQEAIDEIKPTKAERKESSVSKFTSKTKKVPSSKTYVTAFSICPVHKVFYNSCGCKFN